MGNDHKFRESWLQGAVSAVHPLFAAEDIEVPPVRISVGFPGGRSRKSTTIGQCWSTGSSEDGVSQIFIHPSLKDPVEILGVVIHELIHAVDDCASGHKGAFVKMFRALGMAGKPTCSGIGDDLRERLEAISKSLGEYPHAVLASKGPGGVDGPKKQGTRMIKVECPTCGYTARTTRKWLELGNPSCPEGDEMEEA